MSLVPFFMPANISEAVKAVGLYENSVLLMLVNDDAEW